MSRERRHIEFFGPDLARGPVLSGSPPVAAVQVATQLAQLRAPILRSDTEVEDHAEFIRTLADRNITTVHQDYLSRGIITGLWRIFQINLILNTSVIPSKNMIVNIILAR